MQRALGHEVDELGNLSRVRGTIVAEPAGFRLTLEVSDAGRRSLRSIHAEQCHDLARAAALAIALAIHAGPGARGAPPGAQTPASDLEPVGAASSADPPAVERTDDPDDGGAGESPKLSWSAGASAVLDVGALPEPRVGVG